MKCPEVLSLVMMDWSCSHERCHLGVSHTSGGSFGVAIGVAARPAHSWRRAAEDGRGVDRHIHPLRHNFRVSGQVGLPDTSLYLT